METVLSTFLLDVPRAAMVWLALLAVAGLAAGTLFTAPRAARLDDAVRRIRRAALPAPPVVDDESREILRYADEVRIAAERAATAARRRREEWLAAQHAAEAAWRAYESAEAEVLRLTKAAALPLPDAPRTPAEYAFRERHLHRIALRAYRRGGLSVDQFVAVLAGADGWDPRRHPVEQELMLARVVRDNLRARHRAAAEREREAWHARDLAAASALSLRDEAAAAAARAHEVRQRLSRTGSTGTPGVVAGRPGVVPRQRRSGSPVHESRPARSAAEPTHRPALARGVVAIPRQRQVATRPVAQRG